MKQKLDIISVIIAGLALLLSGLTWLGMREQGRLISGQLRPYVQVATAELVEPVNEAAFLGVRLNVRNFGQTAADEVYANMDYALGIPELTGGGEEATNTQVGPMGPGLERSIVLASNRRNRRDFTAGPLGRYSTIYFYGTILFIDSVTEENLSEHWCYRLALRTEADLSRTTLESCGNLHNRHEGTS